MAGETERLKMRLLRAGSILLGTLIVIQLGMRGENPVQFLFDIAFPANDYAVSYTHLTLPTKA